jgi:alpha-glucuronidase
MVGQWYGDAQSHLGNTPSIYLDGHSAIRKTFHNVKIAKGDTLKIVGIPDGVEPAPLDYVAVLPPGVVD